MENTNSICLAHQLAWKRIVCQAAEKLAGTLLGPKLQPLHKQLKDPAN
jgi:hypothetical protein